MFSADEKAGFEVTVRRVGGEVFNEYDVKNSPADGTQPSSSSCWLESEIDATFEIQIVVDQSAFQRSGGHDLATEVFVDGRLISRLALARNPKGYRVTISVMNFMENGVVQEGQLKFAALRTTDNDRDVTLSGPQLQSLGKVRVDLLRGTVGAVQNYPANFAINPDVGVAAEKGKKLGGGIGYTDKKQAALVPTSMKWYRKDPDHLPYYRVDLNYRPRPVLQLLGVVEHDVPNPIAIDPPVPRQPVAQAGPSRKRKAEIIDIDADEEVPDVKPDDKARLATRVGWLEESQLMSPASLVDRLTWQRRLRDARNLNGQNKKKGPMHIVDLTGFD